jgi:pimeloyl-ACP methyl ester carboxylesterase
VLAVCGFGASGAAAGALAPGGLSSSPATGGTIGFRALYGDLALRHDALVRSVWVPYRAWNGARREALLVLPAWYGPRLDPAIPLVISPHGRGGTAAGNAALWGDLPAYGPFAVVNPQGQGRRLIRYSWGWRGQISDLARMPQLLQHALPWLHVESGAVYAVGSSMGGQETLLLDALHPRLLAGAVALDSATSMAARYAAFATLPGDHGLQALARDEIGGTPTSAAAAYAARSPLSYAQTLATDGVPLYIWWSTRDEVVVDQYEESGLLYRDIERIDPRAPVHQYVGDWAHSAEMTPLSQLPVALLELGLIRLDGTLASPPPGAGGQLDSLLVPVEIPPQIPTLTGRARTMLSAELRIPTGIAGSLTGLSARSQAADAAHASRAATASPGVGPANAAPQP